MRVDSIVVVAPVGQLADHGSSVGLFHDADVTRFIVRTKASAMPLDCGLSIGVVRGLRLILLAKRRASLAV